MTKLYIKYAEGEDYHDEPIQLEELEKGMYKF